VQVLNATRPSDFWLQVVAPNGATASPHGVPLHTAVQPVDTFIDCAEYSTSVKFAPDEYPALEDMLCSLVLLGSRTRSGADAPSPGLVDSEVDPITDEVTRDASLSVTYARSMHGVPVAWAVLACATIVLLWLNR
jgi:hypothetical protein